MNHSKVFFISISGFFRKRYQDILTRIKASQMYTKVPSFVIQNLILTQTLKWSAEILMKLLKRIKISLIFYF